MHRISMTIVACIALTAQAMSQGQPAAQAPQIETKKVEGTEGVYTFRNQNSQAMFIVTSDGVIATDPVSYGRPTGGEQYLAEIRKVTNQPIRYVVYSHHHFDHIAGGRAFKEAGARFVAHETAKARLTALNDPNTVLPDETVGRRRTIRLGGTELELTHVGLNHSDSTLVMRLPKERIVFVVDLLAVGQIPGPRHDRLLSLPGGGLDQADPGDGLGAADPRTSGRGRPARNQEGRPGSADLPAGCVRRREAGGAAGSMLGAGRKHAQAAEVRDVAELRGEPAIRAAALLRPLGPRDIIIVTSVPHMCADCPSNPRDNRPASRRLLPHSVADEAVKRRAVRPRACYLQCAMEAVEHRMTAHVLPWTPPASGPKTPPGKGQSRRGDLDCVCRRAGARRRHDLHRDAQVRDAHRGEPAARVVRRRRWDLRWRCARRNCSRSACGAALYLTAQHKTLAALALTYLVGAVGPWTHLFWSHP